MRQVFKVKCAHCGDEIERGIPIKNAACFDCKRKRTASYALKYRELVLPIKKK